MRPIFLLLFTSFTLVSCAHKPLRPPPTGGGLYPMGKYQHAVKIQVQQPTPRTMEMHGVVSINDEQLKVVGLSSFGTTVFRIEENLKTGEMKKEFYLEIMQKHEDRFLEFYKLIRELLTAPKGITEFERQGAKFRVSEPDAQGIYRKVHIEHPQVVLDIEVTGYEF